MIQAVNNLNNTANGFIVYPDYKPSGVAWLGDIPIHWDTMSLKFSLDIPITDGPHETPNILTEGIPFLSAEAVKNDKLDFNKKRGYISIEDHKKFSKKYCPQRGDVYMVKSGATTGNVARVETDEVFNIWSPLAVMRPNKNITSTDFIFYTLKSDYFNTSVQLKWNFGTQQNIGMGVLSNIDITLPPLSEQQAIVKFLDEKTDHIDRLIDKQQQLINKLAEQRTAIISHAVTKGLNPNSPMKNSGVEWLGDIPEHWEVWKATQ
ncbi:MULTISPECIES: restriction endonuclease subunit S [unclassified Acinetobacter]|uniref:restriction endonuclease subunit S n=1 Tax=unclassified Acinetobacter TaxID=196816 RepID=UPI0035BB6B36